MDQPSAPHTEVKGSSGYQLPGDSPPKRAINVESMQATEKAADSAESGAYKLLPLGLEEDKFLQFLEGYLSKLDYQQRSTFADAKKCCEQMAQGYDGHYIKISKSGDVDGLLCVNLDHTCQTEFRAYIRHFSMVDK